MLFKLRRFVDCFSAGALLFAVLIVFGWRARHGIWFSTFSDETGHIVGAEALAAGYRLYRDFIDEHGPLIYAVPQLYGFMFGWAHPNYVRLVPVMLLTLAALSVGASPCLRDWWKRTCAVACFLGLISTVWLVQALFQVAYQPIAGMLLLIAIAQFVLPSWLGFPVGRRSLLVSGTSLALVPFVAFTYGPAAVLLAASGLWARWTAKEDTIPVFFVVGLCIGFVTSLTWMLFFADLRGYIAYHFIAALYYYSPYQRSGIGAIVTVLWPGTQTWALVQNMALAFVIAGLALTLVSDRRRPKKYKRQRIAIFIGTLGLLLTNPRGSPIFQDGAFVVVSFGVFSLALLNVLHFPRDHKVGTRLCVVFLVCVLVGGSEAVARSATTTPNGYTRVELPLAENGDFSPSTKSWARKVRQLSDPNEGVLALPFYPEFYLMAGRLPMKGYFIYLPWDADFSRKPAIGLHHDICVDLPRNLPPVIFYNRWIVWNLYDPDQYAPCIRAILKLNYLALPGEDNLYVRKDRVDRLSKSFRLDTGAR